MDADATFEVPLLVQDKLVVDKSLEVDAMVGLNRHQDVFLGKVVVVHMLVVDRLLCRLVGMEFDLLVLLLLVALRMAVYKQ